VSLSNNIWKCQYHELANVAIPYLKFSVLKYKIISIVHVVIAVGVEVSGKSKLLNIFFDIKICSTYIQIGLFAPHSILYIHFY
jgi:hypothetical protein